MVDGTQPLSLMQEIALLARLRWRIFANSLRRQHAKFELLALIIAAIFFSLLVLALAAGFAAASHALVASGRIGWLALPFWVVFLFWQVFPVFFASLTTHFDFRSLLRFPLHLRSYFILSLAYGAADPVALTALVWLAAIGVGAVSARPALLPGMIGVLCLFAMMNLILERLIGSWLEKVLSRRRTRELVFAVLILVMLFGQFSGILIEKLVRQPPAWFWSAIPYFRLLPAGLAGHGAAEAGRGEIAMVVANLGGLALYGAIFGLFLWRRMAAQYRGEFTGEAGGVAVARVRDRSSRARAEPDALQGLRAPVAAIVNKEMRYLFRNGISWLNLVLPIFLVFLIRFDNSWFVPVAVGYLLLLLMAPAYNAFAFEGRGIQSLFTAPVRFRDVLLGKNLVLSVMLIFEIGLVLTLFYARGIRPDLPRLTATLAAAAFAVPAQLTVANWTSIAHPRRLEFGSFRNQRASGMTVLITLGMQILLGASGALVFLAGRWFENAWLPAGVFALLAAATWGGYFASLDALSSFAEKKREVLIDALCR